MIIVTTRRLRDTPGLSAHVKCIQERLQKTSHDEDHEDDARDGLDDHHHYASSISSKDDDNNHYASLASPAAVMIIIMTTHRLRVKPGQRHN